MKILINVALGSALIVVLLSVVQGNEQKAILWMLVAILWQLISIEISIKNKEA